MDADGTNFPMLCETCLGPNPYLRMVKLPFGNKLCKVTNKPYQSFRWKPAGGRQKECIISFAVAKERNICQACLNDMKYGVAAGLRDNLLKNEPYNIDNNSTMSTGAPLMLKQDGEEETPKEEGPGAKKLHRIAEASQRQQNEAKVAFRNLPKLCSFWVTGTCSRCVRKTCPFRPCCGSYEFPELAPLQDKTLRPALIESLTKDGAASVMVALDQKTRLALMNSGKGQNRDEHIRARVQGNDASTNKRLGIMAANASNKNKGVPQTKDETIVSLWVGRFHRQITEHELRNIVVPHGEVTTVRIMPELYAFVEYDSHDRAKSALSKMHGNVDLEGQSLDVRWGSSKNKKRVREGDGSNGQKPPPPPAAVTYDSGRGAL